MQTAILGKRGEENDKAVAIDVAIDAFRKCMKQQVRRAGRVKLLHGSHWHVKLFI